MFWKIASNLEQYLRLLHYYNQIQQGHLQYHQQPYCQYTMGSTNCKEYKLTNATENNKRENDTSRSHQSTCNIKMMDDHINPIAICNEKDLLEGEMKQFDFTDNLKVLVVKRKGKIHVLGNKCTHYGAPLHTGVLSDGRIRCPWHGACFNLESGDIEDFPGLDSLPCYKVNIESNGQVIIRARRDDVAKSKRIKEMIKRDHANNRTFVIIGGGPAGAVCAETLRQEGFSGRILILCKEHWLPYDRVKISKSFDINIDAIQYRHPEFYDAYGIETLLGVEATHLDTNNKVVFVSEGLPIKYDKLFIATGSTPNKPHIKGADLKNVITVRGYQDAQIIKGFMRDDVRVVCLGSSFIALEAAQSLVRCVASVTVVSRTQLPLVNSFGTQIGERVLRLFIDNNVNMIMNSGIKEVLGDNDGNVKEVVLVDGRKLPCDLLIVGTGVRMNTTFLNDSGLLINDNGSIDVDMYLRSNLSDIWIGGDIANAPVYCIKNERASIGHYQLAQYHGRVAAINMTCPGTKPLKAVPFFFTMLFGKGFRYSGYGQYTDVVIDGDLDNLKFVAYFINDEENVVAVASCGRDPIVAQFAELQCQNITLKRNDILTAPDGHSSWTSMIRV